MVLKNKLCLIFLFIIFIPSIIATSVEYADGWSSNEGSSTDAAVWGGYSLKVNAENVNSYADCICYDWCDDGSDDDTGWSDWDNCYCESTAQRDDCIAYSSWVYNICDAGDCYTTSNLEEQHTISTGSSGDYWKCSVDIREYRDCDDSSGEQGIHNYEGNDGRPYWVVYPKKYDCDGGTGEDKTGTGYYDFEGDYGTAWVDIKNDVSCPSYRVCDEDSSHTYHDDTEYTSATASMTHPCTLEDGTTENHVCSSDDDCYSDDCDGGGTFYRYDCYSDGDVDMDIDYKIMVDSCGGEGYMSAGWNPFAGGEESCLNTAIGGGAGYVCDTDHDDVEQDWVTPTPCRKDIGESCSATTNCWNDDGGNICNSISECTDKANGRDCGIDSDCNSGRCDSTCQAKLSNGNSCDENSDCTSSICLHDVCRPTDPYCGDGYCDDGEDSESCSQDCQQETCSGTFNIVTSDEDLNIYIGSAYESTTDISYFYSKAISGANCGTSYNIVVKCSDNSTTCYSETTYINTDGETATVVDSDCVKTCSEDENIWITNKDVAINNNVINISYHSADFSGSVDIKLQKVSRETGLIDGEHTISSSISATSTKSESYSGFNLNDASGLNIYLESNDDDKADNFVYRVISQDRPDAYISINTSYPEVDSLIRAYLRQYVNEKTNVDDAELIISVGKFTDEFENVNAESLTFIPRYGMYGWGLKGNHVYAYQKIESAQYASLVGRLSYNQPKPTITIFGNSIISDIAGVKKLISAKSLFFSDINTEIEPVVLGTYDRTALGTFDLLKSYRADLSSPSALKAIDKYLFDNIYDIAIRPVKTLSSTSYGEQTTLRVKNVNSDYSAEFREAISETDKPVVLAGGIFSHLESWEEDEGLALKLAEDGRDTWEIEITGGPESDCTGKSEDTCPDYTYNDLVDYFWPALISGVEAYTGKDSIDYIGHSNGCRVALSSINEYSVDGKDSAGYYFDYNTGQYIYSNLSSDVVDTFVGVACPGAFEGQSFFKEYMGRYGEEMLKIVNQKHFTQKYLGRLLFSYCHRETDERSRKICEYLGWDSLNEEGPKISLNFSKDYLEIIQDENDNQPIDDGLEINRFKLIFGYISDDPITKLYLKFKEIGAEPYYFNHDGLSTTKDNYVIADLISSNNNDKTKNITNVGHADLPKDYWVKREIRRFLEND